MFKPHTALAYLKRALYVEESMLASSTTQADVNPAGNNNRILIGTNCLDRLYSQKVALKELMFVGSLFFQNSLNGD
jgi:hypothetical protein